MRPKLSKERKAVSRPMCLYLDQLSHIATEANALNVSLSKFVQALVESDRKSGGKIARRGLKLCQDRAITYQPEGAR